MDYTEHIAELTRRLAAAEKGLSALDRTVTGHLPDGANPHTLKERIDGIEREIAAANIAASSSFVQSDSSDDPGTPLLEIEWGKPSATPTGDSTTITVKLCQEEGTSYDDADTAVLYIRSDRASVDLDRTAWTTSTILSFVRFPIDTTSDTAVGVLVGLGELGMSEADGEVESHTYTFRAHIDSAAIETENFWTLADCLNSWIEVTLEFRYCDDDGLAGTHPFYQGFSSDGDVATPRNSATLINSASGHANYVAVPAPWVADNATVPGAISGYWIASSDAHFVARVTAAGALEIAFNNTVGGGAGAEYTGVVYGKVVVTGYPTTMDMVEVGTGNLLDGGPAGVHEAGAAGDKDESEWGDDTWTPGPL